MVMLSATGQAGSLVATKSNFGPMESTDNPYVTPLDQLYVGFDEQVEILPGATASVLCGEDVVVTSSRCGDPVNYSDSEGYVAFYFDGRLLPKGKEYTFSVAPGSIASRADADVVNAEINVRFYVPSDLGEASWDIEQYGHIAGSSHLTACWPFQTVEAARSEAILYRDNIEVGIYPVEVTWNQDQGQARVGFGRTVRFEKGVEFKVELPEGAACARFRGDIVNKASTLTFIGDCDEIAGSGPVADMVTARKDNDGRLEEVDFIFCDPFVLGVSPKISVIGADGNVIAEVTPYINTMINCFCLSAEFTGRIPEDLKDYLIVLEQGSIITVTGDPLTNRRQAVDGATAGIDGPDNDIRDIASDRCYDLSGRRQESPIAGRISIRNGRKFIPTR